MNRRLFLLVLTPILVVPLLTTAHGQSPPSQKAQPHKTVEHPSWESSYEQNFGITQQGFHNMGLGVLTVDQLVSLLEWAYSREQKARDSVPRTSFTCGRPGESLEDAKPEEYDKVRLYAKAVGDADEIVSGVRERLRAMSGTEVVYSSDEADLTVSLVGLKGETKSGLETNNVSISVVVSMPCLYTRGTHKTQYDAVQDQFLQMGSVSSGAHSIVDSIVSLIDTGSLENQRQSNDGMKKMLQAFRKEFPKK